MKSLNPGDRLGPYEVLAPIGAGGMGEVYRAHDSTLGRDVALKVLPERFAGNPERLARFDREARLLASVNHPNIATIHGVAHSESGPVLVLELIDGQTLQDRLDVGPLPLSEALHISKQLADALEAAHDRGIVHRDLKPANIKIRSDGTVKVLDFGIAKLLGSGDPEGEASGATVTETNVGVAIGTPTYMSPEQARGAEVTRRSDVWAFGAVLFEMLTGTVAFSGPTPSDVLAGILQRTPDWSALPPTTPAAITRLLKRCLEREPRARLHDIGDARIEIEDAERTLRDGEQAPVQPARDDATPWSGRRVGWAAIISVATLGLAIYLWSSRSEDARQEVRLQLAPPTGTRFVSAPAVSPDGRQMVFATVPEAGGDVRLWLRPLSASAATELSGTLGASYPFWSADGRSIAFFAGGRLKRVAATGGNPVIVCDAEAGRGGLWLEDDTIVFAPTAFSPLMRVNAAGGEPATWTRLQDDETGHRFPQRLPNRQLLYFSVNRTPLQSGTRLVAIDDPHRTIAFFPTGGAAEYVNGFLVFVPMGTGGRIALLAQRLALPTGQLMGEPVDIGETRISETLGRYVSATAPSGVIAWLGPTDGIGQFTWVARDGRVLSTVGTPARQFGVELSPDRQQLATFRDDEIWTLDLARTVPIRVTRGVGNRHPIWSPDATQILSLFQGRGLGTFDIVATVVSTGNSATRRQATNMVKPVGWTHDGRVVWIEAAPSATAGDAIWTMPVDGDPAPLLQDGGKIFEARVSPDGRWIAYSTNRSGRPEIEVTSFPVPGPRHLVTVDGGGYPRWRADGRELYFLSPDARLMAATFSPGSPPAIGPPAALFEVRLIAHPDRGSFAALRIRRRRRRVTLPHQPDGVAP